MTSASILLVEKDPKQQRVLAVHLRKAGYEVVVTSTSKEAWEKISAQKFSLVISALTDNGIDGLSLFYRSQEEHPTLPFLFLAQASAHQDKRRALEAGASDILELPLYLREFVTRVRLLLQRQQKQEFALMQEGSLVTTLADLSVLDLLQSVEKHQKTGLLHLESEGRTGSIFLKEGRVIDALLGRSVGEDAMYRLLLWNQGKVRIELGAIQREERIRLSSQELLLEGMRRLEEWSRLLEALPPMHHVCEVDFPVLAEHLSQLPDEVNSIIRLFDGRRTLQQVIDDTNFGALETLTIIGKLYEEGIIYDVKKQRGASQLATPSQQTENWLANVRSLPLEDQKKRLGAETAESFPEEASDEDFDTFYGESSAAASVATSAPAVGETVPMVETPAAVDTPVATSNENLSKPKDAVLATPPTSSLAKNTEASAVTSATTEKTPSVSENPAPSDDEIAALESAVHQLPKVEEKPAVVEAKKVAEKPTAAEAKKPEEGLGKQVEKSQNQKGKDKKAKPSEEPKSATTSSEPKTKEKKAEPIEIAAEKPTTTPEPSQNTEPTAAVANEPVPELDLPPGDEMGYSKKSNKGMMVLVFVCSVVFFGLIFLVMNKNDQTPTTPAAAESPKTLPKTEAVVASAPAASTQAASTSIPASQSVDYKAFVNAGDKAFQESQFDAAITSYRSAVDMAPDGVGAMVGLGNALYQKSSILYDSGSQEQKTEAIALLSESVVVLEKAYAQDPNNLLLVFSLAVAYEFRSSDNTLSKNRQEDRQKARTAYENYLKLAPNGSLANEANEALKVLSQ